MSPIFGFRIIFCMEPRNQTADSEFLLLELTDDPALQPMLFSLFLSIYLVTVLGKLFIIVAVNSDTHLPHPMYFFLSNLSFTDTCLSTSTIPKMLVNIHSQSWSISYTGCLSQVFFVLAFLVSENCSLTAMVYVRYVAICHPLMYTIIMNPSICVMLVLISLFMSIVDALLHTLMVLILSLCTDLQIPHFFCELAQVIKPAFSDTLINNILIYVFSILLGGSAVFGGEISEILMEEFKRFSLVQEVVVDHQEKHSAPCSVDSSLSGPHGAF
ncbi:olfactory receptor 7G2-like [Sciurus carolinensis]|uniref:olfactory receptor 7G2-like n=1 Tax=Sciurus carolinensis TaxID=30640 RepID=UPI001FB56C62|nr:olfactory receptor 7G2-like [Sciurus carolinensis]